MVIRVSEIPEEGLRFEGPEAFPEPFQDLELAEAGSGGQISCWNHRHTLTLGR